MSGPWPSMRITNNKYDIQLIKFLSCFLFYKRTFHFIEKIFNRISVSNIKLIFCINQLLLFSKVLKSNKLYFHHKKLEMLKFFKVFVIITIYY